MKKIITISSVLLGIVFLAGCGQQANQNNSSTTANSNQPAQKQDTSKANQPAAVATKESANTALKDCGSVDNMHIFVSPQEMTSQEKETLSCVNKAFADCSPATITLSGNGGGKYEIRGKDNQNCIITQTMTSPQSSKKCKIPSDFITASSDEAKIKNQSDKLFVLTVPFAFSMGKATNAQTGQVVTFECN
jgi:PBP1b-binding outer membrane lipoprotein LpoB